MAAKYATDAALIRLLVEAGADINALDANAETPIYWHLRSNDSTPVLKELLDRGAALDVQSKRKDTPLHFALRRNGSLRVIQFLLEGGPNLTLTGRYDGTLLHSTAVNSHVAVFDEMLHEIGPDVDFAARDSDGETPFHWAARWNTNPAMLDELLQRHADPTTRDKKGNTLFALRGLQKAQPGHPVLHPRDNGQRGP